ncbi:MAG: hypothetical protein IT430_16435 [Phycisphaerales bacterium]|nr:hypothetical protein [Phycisphaerales bacterium]
MDHLWGIPTGLGVKLDDSVICEECGNEMETQREDYAGVARWAASSSTIKRLIDETHPEVFARRSREIAAAASARGPGAMPQARIHCIAQILLRASRELDQRVIQVRLDPWSGLALLGVLTPLVIGLARANGWIAGGAAGTDDVLLYGGLASLALLLALVATDVPRFMNREVYPRLVRVLHPLNPTSDEIARAVASLRGSSHAIARKISVKKLCRLLESGP